MTAVTPGNKKNQFNLLSQARRQSGSTFKTFVLAAAIEQGINPRTSTYLSAPFFYKPTPDGDCEDSSGGWWCPETYDHSYTGWTSIERATLRSDNTVYAQLTLDVGPEAVADMARKLGVRSPLDVKGAYVPAIGLGAMDVSPLDMASPTRRSPPAASTPSRWRSARSSARAGRTRKPAGASRSASA